jgi:hypothetical protein
MLNKHVAAMKRLARTPQWWHRAATVMLDQVEAYPIFSAKELGFIEQMLILPWATEKQQGCWKP